MNLRQRLWLERAMPFGPGLSCSAPSPGTPGLGPGGLPSLSRARLAATGRLPDGQCSVSASVREIRSATSPKTDFARMSRHPPSLAHLAMTVARHLVGIVVIAWSQLLPLSYVGAPQLMLSALASVTDSPSNPVVL